MKNWLRELLPLPYSAISSDWLSDSTEIVSAAWPIKVMFTAISNALTMFFLYKTWRLIVMPYFKTLIKYTPNYTLSYKLKRDNYVTRSFHIKIQDTSHFGTFRRSTVTDTMTP
jgi:hypothetical protein